VHESSVVEQLIRIAKQQVNERNAKKVYKISLVVGEGTGYMEESLKYYFNIMSRGSELEGAELAVRYIKTQLFCENCGEHFERKLFSFECPKCGKTGKFTKIGQEFYIDSMEVEK
jgi:hydrogenase nickel incorporation protein HypA/HybF